MTALKIHQQEGKEVVAFKKNVIDLIELILHSGGRDGGVSVSWKPPGLQPGLYKESLFRKTKQTKKIQTQTIK